jgi:hypothetical protein
MFEKRFRFNPKHTTLQVSAFALRPEPTLRNACATEGREVCAHNMVSILNTKAQLEHADVTLE